MIKDEFYDELKVIQLENSILLAALHLKQVGYESWHDKIYQAVVSMRNRKLKLGEEYEQLLTMFNAIIDQKSDDQDVEDIRELMIIRIEFPQNHYFYKNTGFFKELRNGSIIERDHRVCHHWDFGGIQTFYRDGVLRRGM